MKLTPLVLSNNDEDFWHISFDSTHASNVITGTVSNLGSLWVLNIEEVDQFKDFLQRCGHKILLSFSKSSMKFL